MPTPLQDFRRRHPEYNDWEDEELAGAVYDKFYSNDLSPAEYRQQMQLPPLKAPVDPDIAERMDANIRNRDNNMDPFHERGGLGAFSTDPASEENPPFSDWKQAEERGTLNNSIRLLAERGSTLLGHAVRGVVGAPGEAIDKKIDNVFGGIVFGSDWGPDDPEDGSFRIRWASAKEYQEIKQRPGFYSALNETVPDYLTSRDFGGVEKHTSQAIKNAYNDGQILGTAGAVLGFGIEQGITSLPDMIMVMLGPVGLGVYVGARADEMGEIRAQNKGMEQATMVERFEALPGAVGSALFEKFGVTKIIDAFGKKAADDIGAEIYKAGFKEYAKRIGTKAGTAAVVEAGTEAVQEGVIEYLTEKLGTDAQIAYQEMVERGFFGALAGGVAGGALGAVAATAGEVVRAGDKAMVDDISVQNAPGEVRDSDFDADGNIVYSADAPIIKNDPTDQTQTVDTFDPRLKRSLYRYNLAGLGDELDTTEGATNPEWFEANKGSNLEMSASGVQEAVRKSLVGEKLGVGEARIVQSMLDRVTGRRLEDNAVDRAKDKLEQARRARDRARSAVAAETNSAPTPLTAAEADSGGELFVENEYPPAMAGETRILDELTARLDTAGDTAKADEIIAQSSTLAEALKRIEALTHGRQTAIDPPQARAPDQSPTGPQARVEEPTAATAPGIRETTTPAEVTLPGGVFDETGKRVERRQDIVRRERIQGMSVDQVVSELYTDPLTGLSNERALEEDLPTAGAIASIDADGLGGINDHLGHTAGDGFLKAVAKAINETGVDVVAYRKSGDEFYIIGDNEQQVTAAINNAKTDLSNQVIEASNGKVVGLNITTGVGKTRLDADTNMEAMKKTRAAAGLRNPKGVLPPGSVLNSSMLNMAAGNNRVDMIGKDGELPMDPNHSYLLGDGRTVRIPDKPIRRKDIMNQLQRRFGVKIFQGRVKGKTSLGFYRKGWGEIRIKNSNDMEVTAHELAHWLDDRHPWISKLYREYKTEMLGVSYDATKDYEGFAEFLRTWFTQDHEARESAPGFYDAWMSALADHTNLETVAKEIQEMMHAWYLQGARARLEDRYGKLDVTIKQRIMDFLRPYHTQLLQRTFDALRPFAQIETLIHGKLRSAALSGYKALRLARGARGVAEAVFYKGSVKWLENGDIAFNGKGIKEIFAPVQHKMVEMQNYMVARRAEELLEQGRENHVRPDEIQRGLQFGKDDPAIADVFDEWLDFNTRMLDFYQESGLISEDGRTAIDEMNKNYVPFNRIMDSTIGETVKRGGGSPFMKLKGGTDNINDVFDSIVANTTHLIQMSLVNRGKQNFYKMLDKSDNQTAGLYAAPLSQDNKPNPQDEARILKSVLDGLDLDLGWFRQAEKMPKDAAEADLVKRVQEMAADLAPVVSSGLSPKGSNIDFYYNKGVKVFYEIADPALMEAIVHIGPQTHNLGLGILGGFANVLRRGVTLTPTFQVKNFIRDTMNAFTLSKGKMVPAAAAIKALGERMYNDEHYWEYMINGGGFSNMVEADGLRGERVLNTRAKITRFLDQGLGAFELANRIAEFKVLKAKGWNSRDAALAGREISTDFAMRGSSEFLRWFTVSVPFLNARLQGLYRNGRELAALEDGKLKFAGRQAFSYALRSMISITLPSFIAYMMVRDDERYKNLPDWVRDLSWVFFTGDGEDDYVMIPKPFETGMLWGTLPERMLEYMHTHDEHELATAMEFMALQTFQMNVMPQAFKPLDDLRRNKKFTGAPIIPEYMQGIEPMEQYKHYTSEALIALGRKMNISPLKAEHLVRGYFGTLGAWSLGMADFIVGDVTNSGADPTKGWKDNFLLSSFVNDGPLKRTHAEDHFYELLKETRGIVDSVRQIRARSPERVDAYLAPKQAVYMQLNARVEDAAKRMRGISNRMDIVRRDTRLSADEKRDQLFFLQRQKNEVANKVRDAINPQTIQEIVDIETGKRSARAMGQ